MDVIRPITTVAKAFKVFLLLATLTLVLLVSMKTLMSWRMENNNSKAGGEDEDVVLNELLLNPGSVGWSDGFIELYNKGGGQVDLRGWRIYASGSSTELSGSISPGKFLAYYGGIADEYSEEIFLKNRDGMTLDTYSYDLRPAGISVGRSPDGGASWVGFENPTPGGPNAVASEAQPTTTVAAPECMVDEYYSIADDISALGFTGDSYQFCSSFNREVSALDPLVMERISELEDESVKSAIVREVAERDVARKREERVLTLTVSDSAMLDSLAELFGPEIASKGFDGEIAAMGRKFRGMMYDIVKTGSPGEKAELKLQLKFYMESRERGGVRLLKLNPDEARLMLRKGKTTDDIILALSS